ncbi:MAG: HAMP domain-containing sensor histidine kinase, partial [Bacteroidia bacterium]
AILGYAMPVLMCSIVIFRGKHLIPGIITGIVNVSILITVISLNYHFPFAYTLSEDQLLQQRLLNFGGITSLSLLITYFIIRVNENIHKAILSQTKIIEQSNSKLKETIKTRDKLFSLIAHDLKGPFQSMSASLEILSAADTTSKDKEMVIEHLSKKAENTIVLLNNLLLWSQHQTETIKFRPESIKLNKVRESMLDIFKLQAAEKDIRIDFLMSDDLLSIYADKNMFECILRNLISNSIKFTAKGGKILIKAKQEGMYVRFEIEDNGVGMDDLVKEMLTNKQSYSSTGTNREVGHGLGMMLIHEFLKFHKSSLEIESEQGKGSKFSFLLNNA